VVEKIIVQLKKINIMPGYMKPTYKKGSSVKKKMKKTKRKYQMGGSNMAMPNDVMAFNRAQQGKSMKGAMKLFNALAKKLGKNVK